MNEQKIRMYKKSSYATQVDLYKFLISQNNSNELIKKYETSCIIYIM